jgi:transcriptional regulator with XRE-family HTH domain
MNGRVQILKDWRAQEGRKQIWVAQQVGCSPQWLSYVLKGRKPLSDKLARALRETLGILLVDESQALGHGHHQKARVKTRQRTGPERVREGSR